MKIIIAPWGNPEIYDSKNKKYVRGYSKVTYAYNDKRDESFSSTLALANILKSYMTVVILSSTLYTNIYNGEYAGVGSIKYNEITDKIIAHINSFLTDNNVNSKPNLWVAPGVGRFKSQHYNKTLIFKTKQGTRQMDLYFNYIYYKTLELLKSLDNNIEIHLDLTHGINYMPLLTHQAIKLASQTFAASSGKNVKVHVYNSDPFTLREDNPSIILNINKVEEITYEGYSCLPSLLIDVLATPDFSNTYKIDKIMDYSKKIEVDTRLVERMARASSMGILLALGVKLKDIQHYYSKLDELLKEFFNNIELTYEEKNDELIFTYNHNLHKEVSSLHATLLSISSIKLEVEDGYIRLDNLSKLNSEYYKKTMVPVYALTKEEVDNIKEYVKKKNKGKPLNKPILYAQLRREPFYEELICKPEPRNIYAHAGIDENSTFLYTKDNHIYLSYRECLDKVLECLDKEALDKIER